MVSLARSSKVLYLAGVNHAMSGTAAYANIAPSDPIQRKLHTNGQLKDESLVKNTTRLFLMVCFLLNRSKLELPWIGMDWIEFNIHYFHTIIMKGIWSCGQLGKCKSLWFAKMTQLYIDWCIHQHTQDGQQPFIVSVSKGNTLFHSPHLDLQALACNLGPTKRCAQL